MRKLIAAIMVAGAALVGGQAIAADFPYYPPVIEIPDVDYGVEGSFYLRGSAAGNLLWSRNQQFYCPPVPGGGCGAAGTVVTETASENGYGYSLGAGFGYETGDGLRAESCVVTKCGGNYALLANNGALVKDCVVYSNQVSSTCVSLNEGAVVQNCALVGNGPSLYGIKTGSGSRILDCAVARNQLRAGIYAAGGSQISGCAALSNVGSEASSYGIYAGSGSTVENCAANWQTSTLASGDSTRGMGVYVDAGSCVRDCLVRYNMGDGIRVLNYSRVERCLCAMNGSGADAAGIHAVETRNVLADNQLLGNDRGMDVDMAGNLIYRNACTFNTVNWSIAAGNGVGAIVVAADSAGVSGDGGGSGTGLGTTDPWANFTY